MQMLIVGASRGLGRAFIEGLPKAGDRVVGVSRKRPSDISVPDGVELDWIEADLAAPEVAAKRIHEAAPDAIDVLIYNAGVWEPAAFTSDYAFLSDTDATLREIINVNVTSSILVLKRLVPRLLASPNPRLLLTGSTSGLPGCGRPEVGYGASKSALNGVASALREGFRSQRLAVTMLQLGNLNTDDDLNIPVETAAARENGELVPVHDVVALVRTLLSLSPASFVRELVMPAIGDTSF